MQRWPGDIQKIVNLFENHNKIENSEYLSKLVQKLYDQLEIKAEHKNHPVLIVEPAITSREYKIKLSELMFEQFESPYLQFHKAPLLSSYLFNKDNLIMIDSGGYNTYVTPIQEGQINEKAVIRANIGGEYLTQELRLILQQSANKSKLLSSIKQTMTSEASHQRQ